MKKILLYSLILLFVFIVGAASLFDFNPRKEYDVPYGRNNYKAQILIELYAGLRMGEINALKPSDIKLTEDGGFIHVERTVSRGINCRPFISDSTKTDAGIRDVPISKPLVPVLQKAIRDEIWDC